MISPQALLTTDLSLTAPEIVQYFVRRWPGALWAREATFEETRRHLGVETQQQWSERAIARTTPVLLALFPLVTLLVDQLPVAARRSPRRAAWYPKWIYPCTFETMTGRQTGPVWLRSRRQRDASNCHPMALPGLLPQPHPHDRIKGLVLLGPQERPHRPELCRYPSPHALGCR